MIYVTHYHIINGFVNNATRKMLKMNKYWVCSQVDSDQVCAQLGINPPDSGG